MSEENETSSSNQQASDESTIDEIASLLSNEDEEDVSKESNDDEQESDSGEEESSNEESTNESESELNDEITWESALGISEDKLSFDDDGNVKGIKVKISGESSEVSMNDLVAGYQQNKAITLKGQALSEERKSFDSAMNKGALELKSKLEDVNNLSQYLEKQLVADYDSINWDALRVENPAEYAALRQDYSSKAQNMEQVKQLINSEKGNLDREQMEKFNENQVKFFNEQKEKMFENNPGWLDEKVFAADMASMKDFCTDCYGFNNDDFAQVQDARLIELIKDAQKYRKGVKQSSKKKKAIVPKFQKSSGSKKKTSRVTQLTQKAAKATGYAKRDLQAEAVAELLIG